MANFFLFLLLVAFIIVTINTTIANAADVSFLTAVNYATENQPQSVTAEDFNGDGRADLAVVACAGGNSMSNNVSILLGHGDGTFAEAISYRKWEKFRHVPPYIKMPYHNGVWI